MLKLRDNPSITYPPDTSVQDMDGTWWVAHTKSRQEKAIAHDLARMGISYFLPIFEKLTIIRGRRFRPLVPLFTSYVFACGTEEQRSEMFTTNRLAGAIPVVDQELFVDELAQIQKAVEAQVTFDPWPYLKVGRRCRVTSGPLKGVEGIIEKRKKITRLVLTVHTLGQAVSLEIDAALVEPIY